MKFSEHTNIFLAEIMLLSSLNRLMKSSDYLEITIIYSEKRYD